MAIEKIAHAQQDWEKPANHNFEFLDKAVSATPEEWTNLTPLNGFTGNIWIRKLQATGFAMTEIKVDLDCNMNSNALYKTAIVPQNYVTSSNRAVYTTCPAQRGVTNTFVNSSLYNSRELIFYRDGSEKLNIDHIFGHIFFMQ